MPDERSAARDRRRIWDLFDARRDGEATALARSILQQSGPNGTDGLDARMLLALVRFDAGERDAALQDMSVVVEDASRVLGPRHKDTLSVRLSLVRKRATVDPARTSERELRDLYVDLSAVVGAANENTLEIELTLAARRADSTDVASAVKVLEQLEHARRSRLGPVNWATLAALGELARRRERAGQSDRALETLSDLIDRTWQDEPQHLAAERLAALDHRAALLTSAQLMTDAVRDLMEACELSRALHGPDDARTAGLNRRLAAVRSSSSPNAADSWRVVQEYERRRSRGSQGSDPSMSAADHRRDPWQPLTIQQFVDDAAILSAEHNRRLSTIIGDRASWRFEPGSRRLWPRKASQFRFIRGEDDLVCSGVHLLGSAAPGPQSWMWAWANETYDGYASEVRATSRHIREHGERFGIAALTQAEIPFTWLPEGYRDPRGAAAVICDIAKTVTGLWTSYHPYDSGLRIGYLLEHPDFALPVPRTDDIAAVLADVTRARWLSDWRRALDAYAGRRGVLVEWSSDSARATVLAPDGEVSVRVSPDGQRAELMDRAE